MMDRETEKLWDAFVEMMTRTGVFARLAEQAGRYIGRLSNEDREAVLEIAIGMAWTGAQHFDPKRRALLSYWDGCLAEAIRTRMVWRQRYFNVWYPVSADYILEVA